VNAIDARDAAANSDAAVRPFLRLIILVSSCPQPFVSGAFFSEEQPDFCCAGMREQQHGRTGDIDDAAQDYSFLLTSCAA
jgi:hypothetical protein